MAQLLSGVSSTAHYWPVDEIPESDYVRCEDEVARVLVRHPTRQQIRVERGVEGTTAASHAADAEVSPAYVVGTDGGGEQTIRLYEFAFNFDDAFVNNDYEVFATILNAGYIVYSACLIVSNWTGTAANDTSFEVVCGPPGDQEPFLEYTAIGTGALVGRPMEILSLLNFRAVTQVEPDDQIAIAVWPGAGSLTAGSAKVIVLVAEPV